MMKDQMVTGLKLDGDAIPQYSISLICDQPFQKMEGWIWP